MQLLAKAIFEVPMQCSHVVDALIVDLNRENIPIVVQQLGHVPQMGMTFYGLMGDATQAEVFMARADLRIGKFIQRTKKYAGKFEKMFEAATADVAAPNQDG